MASKNVPRTTRPGLVVPLALRLSKGLGVTASLEIWVIKLSLWSTPGRRMHRLPHE